MAEEVFVGRVRSLATHSLWSLATAGLYFFFWYAILSHEVRKNRGAGMRPALVLVLFLVLPVIGWFLVPFLSGRSVRRLQLAADADKRSSPWYPALWGLLPIVGWTASVALLQAGANSAWISYHDRHSEYANPTTLECPKCTNRFEHLLNPVAATAVSCPQCGHAGAV